MLLTRGFHADRRSHQRHAADRPRNGSAAPVHAPSVRHRSANLGEKSGVSFQQIQKFAKGINRLSAGMLVRICQSLEVSPMEILGAYFQDQRPSCNRMVWLQEKLLTAERKLSGVRRALRDK
ncbi:helix-turn-helix transcriptional regulator [Sinorhizobium meliloti]|uniref:helix-turn-helix transcriptional regulator n=1 Tax=Rhizobium meliloti TaxID=382 RepID=UPI002D79EC3F|nr:helix-turn-helix transcriptional regulator [Sinorhizobium meliloti]